MLGFIVTLIAGAIIWECLRRAAIDYHNPYKLSCIHCKNGGNQFVISGSEMEPLEQIMADHKRDVHPYAA